MKNDIISNAVKTNQFRHEKGEFLHKLLNLRWSPRAFSSEELDRKELIAIFDAGRQAASSFNEQPWYFLLSSKNDEAYERFFNCLTDFNQEWVHTAPYLGIAFGKTHFTGRHNANPHKFYDVGAFMAYASLYAVTQDIFIHQMAGFSGDKVKEQFEIPEKYEPITMFVIGKRGSVEQLPEHIRKKENPDSERKAVSDFLFIDKWGNSI